MTGGAGDGPPAKKARPTSVEDVVMEVEDAEDAVAAAQDNVGPGKGKKSAGYTLTMKEVRYTRFCCSFISVCKVLIRAGDLGVWPKPWFARTPMPMRMLPADQERQAHEAGKGELVRQRRAGGQEASCGLPARAGCQHLQG